MTTMWFSFTNRNGKKHLINLAYFSHIVFQSDGGCRIWEHGAEGNEFLEMPNEDRRRLTDRLEEFVGESFDMRDSQIAK